MTNPLNKTHPLEIAEYHQIPVVVDKLFGTPIATTILVQCRKCKLVFRSVNDALTISCE